MDKGYAVTFLLKSSDLHPDVTSFTVALYNRKTGPYKDKEMGMGSNLINFFVRTIFIRTMRIVVIYNLYNFLILPLRSIN